MWAPSYFGCVAPFSDEVTVNPLLFYTHRLLLVKHRCCSNLVAEPPWSFTLENILELMKFRLIWSWRKTLEGHGDHPRWMLVISWMVEKAAAIAHSSHRNWPKRCQSFVLSLDLQAPFSSRHVLLWFVLGCFFFFLIFTVYGLCEPPTTGKIKVNQVLPFNSDQHTQFSEVSCYHLKKLLPACKVFHCLCWCSLYIFSYSTAIIPTHNSWYSHKYIQHCLFPRFESITFLFSCIH